MKLRAPAGSEKLLRKQSRGAGMVLRRTGPKHPVVCANLFVSNAGVIGDPTGRCAPELFKNLPGTARREKRSFAKTIGESAEHVQIRSYAFGRGILALTQENTPFQIGGGAVFLGPLRGG